jgi:hypothetical protein
VLQDFDNPAPEIRFRSMVEVGRRLEAGHSLVIDPCRPRGRSSRPSAGV